MTEERDEMLRQPRKFCTWMLNLAFAAVLFAVLVKVMMLSQDVEDSRRMLKELSSNLSKMQRENEYLKKELRNIKPKVENIVRKFSKAQKVSDVRRSAAKRNVEAVEPGVQKKPKCRRKHTCLETYFKENPLNCSMIRHCMPPQERTKDLIQVHQLKADKIEDELSKGTGLLTVVWREYFPKPGNIVFSDMKRIKIPRGGIYFVYCSLRVGSEYVEEVSISTYHNRTTLFSTKISNTNANHEVKLYGQANILNGTDLYVQVKPRPGASIPKNVTGLRRLFPGYSADNSMEYNNFGAFLVSQDDLS